MVGAQVAIGAPKFNFCNENKLTIPEQIGDFFNKGPKFRVTHNMDKRFLDNTRLNLGVLTYKVCWHENMKDKNQNSKNYLKIPFYKINVNLPPKMSSDKENTLSSMKKFIAK